MARFALVLLAVLILTFSAGLTRSQPEGIAMSAGAPNVAGSRHETDAFRAEVVLINRTGLPSAARRSPGEEQPAPALLIYLALILVGSAVSVLSAHRRLHRGAQANS